VGIGGAGMSAIATVLIGMGHEVSGSDARRSPAIERLAALGARVTVGHHPAGVGAADLVTRSGAVGDTNVEIVEARRRGLPVASRADVLAAICVTRRTLAVSGTHGKTTTTAMVATVLEEAGWNPSFIIGGEVETLGGAARWSSRSPWLVVEADESDGTFLRLGAEAVVVTNVADDHLDFYGDRPALDAAFEEFLSTAPTVRVACADDPGAAAVTAVATRRGAPVATYGQAPDATYRMVGLVGGRGGLAFSVELDGSGLADIELRVPGVHNARNACAAVALGHSIGVPAGAAARGLARFSGVARRFELRGSAGGVTFVDDYAHLPAEVAATLAAARAGGWERVVAVFQPHRFSRIAALWREFADAFVDADLTVVTDVYPAGEAPVPGITGQLIVDAVRGAHPTSSLRYVASRSDLAPELVKVLRSGDICLTLGAGDITELSGELLSRSAG
jgi:UDP-N-acetylmuramate--alanine ligase